MLISTFVLLFVKKKVHTFKPHLFKLYCLNMKGETIWEKDLGRMSTAAGFGEGSSPALFGDTIILNWDHEGDSFIVALDKKTGEEKWRTDRDEGTSWTSPLILRDSNPPQVP